jgi:hypothetical protein
MQITLSTELLPDNWGLGDIFTIRQGDYKSLWFIWDYYFESESNEHGIVYLEELTGKKYQNEKSSYTITLNEDYAQI